MDDKTHQLLGSLHAKVDILLQERQTDRVDKEKLTERVGALEHEKTKLYSYAAVVSLFASVGAWIIERWFSHA